MARQPINHGAVAGDGTGESLFDAFQKVNANETELYAAKTEIVANEAALPVTGEATKLYVAYDTGVTYKWTGTAYRAITLAPAYDGSGNVTGLVGANGGRIAQLQMGVPDGIDWLTDTLHGFDIYSSGFVERPTLFFDPTATSSLNRGTFAHPYNTQAALQAAIAGNMAGHVLGLKRGTTLQVTGTNGLALTCYGSSTDPFRIVPYGDAEALPIISGHSAVTTWALCSGSTTVYKYTLATESDIWQNGTRVWKLNPTNGATNNNTGTTVINEATAVTALDAKGAGWSVYVGGVLYFRPYSGENPNLGQCVIAVSDYAFLLKYSDVATSGYIETAGLDVRYARTSAFSIAAAGVTTISAAAGIKVAGCRTSRAGVDTTSPGACDALVIYGPSDAVRLSGLYVAGNYAEDALNNAVEIAGTTGAIVEHNRSYNCGGNSIVELWSSNSGAQIRYNRGELSTLSGRMYQSFAQSGIWFANYAEAAGNWNGNDATNAKNASNAAYFNLILNPYIRAVRMSGGTGHKFQHNTCYSDPAITHPGTTGAPQGVYTEGTAATGFCDISNNLFYWSKAADQTFHAATMMRINVNPLGAAASVPSGNNNIYFAEWATGNGGWYYSGAQTGSFTTYKTALSAYSLDQNSLASSNFTGGTLTSALLGFSETTYTPLAANAAGLTTLTGIGTRYRQGSPYVAASATIGCSLGT